jgi:hypothetical protein
MAFEREEREALYLLQSIENGTSPIASIRHLVDEADPALVHLIFSWLRTRYAKHPAAEGVLGRMVELSKNASISAKLREGKSDAIVSWFEEEHDYREFSASDFIALVVEKLES